jgi:hypothetical protein
MRAAIKPKAANPDPYEMCRDPRVRHQQDHDDGVSDQ